MSSKTISLKHEAYDRLRAARRYPSESFSEVVLRATWPEDTVSGRELLARLRRNRAWFSAVELDAIAAAKRAGAAPEEEPWSGR